MRFIKSYLVFKEYYIIRLEFQYLKNLSIHQNSLKIHRTSEISTNIYNNIDTYNNFKLIIKLKENSIKIK